MDDTTWAGSTATADGTLTLADLERVMAELPPRPFDYMIEALGQVLQLKQVHETAMDYPLGSVLVSPELADKIRQACEGPGDMMFGLPIYTLSAEERVDQLVKALKSQQERMAPFIMRPLPASAPTPDTADLPVVGEGG